MARASKVSPSLEPYISSDDEVDDMEGLNVASLNMMGELVFHALHKKKFACSNFMKILAFAIESTKTIEKMEEHEREYANEIATLSEALEEQQTTNESLEETFTLELSKVKESRDRALEVAHDFQIKNDELVIAHAKLLEDFELLKNGSRAIESELIKLTESHEQFKALNLIELAKLPSPCAIIDNACATNSTSCEASILKENVELRAQLALLTSNYEKLEESHGKLSSSHDDLLVSHDLLKLAHEAIMSKVKSYATIAKSRQIENTETPNENAATPVNSPESVEYSSDDLDEDYVELDDDFIEKCNATTDARKIKKLLAEHAVRYKLSPDPKFATSPINIRDKDYDFSLDLSHIAIVEKTPFCGTEKESAVEHLTELSTLSGVFSDDVKMRTYFVAKIFPFSLKDDAKTWYNNLPPGSIKSPIDLRDVFFRKYFPASAQHAALQRIYNFDQEDGEKLPEAWARFCSLIRAQPDHDLEKHDLLDIFYSGLTIESRAYLDSCAGCVFRKRTPDDAEELLAKIGRNHDDWSTPEPTPTPIVKKRGMIKLNDEDMREAKKSLKEKGIKPEDVKNLPPIEDICETIPPSSMIEDFEFHRSQTDPMVRDGWSITENELNAYIERESRRAREDVEEAEEHPDSSSDAASSSYQHHGHVEPPRYSSAQGPYYHSMYDPPAWNSDPRWE
ncbi:hypothetical protein QYE76_063758 [Lolium multiflorum]|uniref:Retrotransposon gag domain-containing protein n=1 Tax=Lolium multiflorum TaxID=4521 RepID=A0AAD8S6B7_LOLMU|nr:hypothetical protein QYE76_063758 [Lolium multiflorum]